MAGGRLVRNRSRPGSDSARMLSAPRKSCKRDAGVESVSVPPAEDAELWSEMIHLRIWPAIRWA